MALSLNTLNIVPIQGQIDLPSYDNVTTAMVDTSVTAGTTLVPGQPVKQLTTSNGIPKMIPLAANTDKTAGFIAYDPKDGGYLPGKPFELAMSGAVMFMTSGAAIVSGASLEVVYTTNTVITNGGTNQVIGTALDAATASGQLIRVKIKLPTL
jgi:hypothetical protein